MMKSSLPFKSTKSAGCFCLVRYRFLARFLRIQQHKNQRCQRHQQQSQHHRFAVIVATDFAQIVVNQRGERLPFGAR